MKVDKVRALYSLGFVKITFNAGLWLEENTWSYKEFHSDKMRL